MEHIIECDLKYSDKLYKLYTDYPLALKHFTVSPDMLSDLRSEIKDTNWKPSRKLIVNLLDKTNKFAITEIFNFTSNAVSV